MRHLTLMAMLFTLSYSSDMALQQEIQKLKKEMATLKVHQNEQSDDIDELYDISERAEANSFADKLKFGVGYRLNLDNFSKTYSDGSDATSAEMISSKLMLNFGAKITPTMKFTGRLSMYKYWGGARVHPYSYYDNMQGRAPADSALYVERAYLDWLFFKDTTLPVVLTLGRQPSGDGPSHQFKENISRKATYSALLYDGASDGAVMTLNLSKILNYEKTYLRFGYAKGFTYTESTNGIGNAYVGASNSDIKDTNVFGVFLDTPLFSMENSLIQLSYSKMSDIVANPLDANSSSNTNIGDVALYGAMLEVSDYKEYGLDFFVHYAHSIASPNGNGYQTYGTLLGANSATQHKSGDAVWLGSRYGFGANKKYKLGFEYNHGSKNWISLTQGSFDIYNKLATRGDAYEAYLMYVANRYTNVRVGYVDIDYKYSRSGWFVGESQALSKLSSAKELDSLASIYLKLVVEF